MSRKSKNVATMEPPSEPEILGEPTEPDLIDTVEAIAEKFVQVINESPPSETPAPDAFDSLQAIVDETNESAPEAEPPAPEAKPGPALSATELAQWTKIRSLSSECDELEAEWESLHSEASAAKKRLELRVDELRSAVRCLSAPLEPLLAAMEAVASGAPAPEAPDVPGESWRDVDLADVLDGIPAKKFEALAEAGLTTLGKFEDFRAEHGEHKWPLHGIGADWKTKIEDKAMEWLAAWRAERNTLDNEQPVSEEAAATADDVPGDSEESAQT